MIEREREPGLPSCFSLDCIIAEETRIKAKPPLSPKPFLVISDNLYALTSTTLMTAKKGLFRAHALSPRRGA